MAKRIKLKPQERSSVLFDIVFEDSSPASNRRVPIEILGGLDGDEPARQVVEEHEAEIAVKAGPPRFVQARRQVDGKAIYATCVVTSGGSDGA